MKIALISTPRSGNTWVRFLLSDLFKLEQYAIHHPRDLAWENLPPNCIVQLHWRNEIKMREHLKNYGFQVVSVVRHPIDVLISILQFATHEPQTALWLDGEGGDESTILGADPTSNEFLEYVLSERVKLLLSISQDWCLMENSLSLVYENLVETPVETLREFCTKIGVDINPPSTIIPSHSITSNRARSQNNHFWQGTPGLWRKLIPARAAFKMGRHHAELIASLGYECNPDLNLSESEAISNWQNLT